MVTMMVLNIAIIIAVHGWTGEETWFKCKKTRMVWKLLSLATQKGVC